MRDRTGTNTSLASLHQSPVVVTVADDRWGRSWLIPTAESWGPDITALLLVGLLALLGSVLGLLAVLPLVVLTTLVLGLVWHFTPRATHFSGLTPLDSPEAPSTSQSLPVTDALD